MVSHVISEKCPRKVINMASLDTPMITGISKEVLDYYSLNKEGIAAKVREPLR